MYIYCITNLINNKKYVGKHSRPSSKSTSYLGSGRIIAKAVKKYGKENFVKEILEDNLSAEELDEREIFWIEELKTRIPEGYNLTVGGEGTAGYKKTKEQIDNHRRTLIGRKASEETKKKISQANKGVKKSPEHVEKLRRSLIGRTLSEEHKKKIGLGNKGKVTSQEHKEKIRKSNKKTTKVKQIDFHTKQLVEVHPSINEAARKTGIDLGGISNAANGKYKQFKGFIWEKVK